MLRIGYGREAERDEIYALRHRVYAQELGQHAANRDGRLSDPLDARNLYIVARDGGGVRGFVSITPPGGSFSLDRYFERATLPFDFDDGLYEIRILTLDPGLRLGVEAGLLMYAAFREIERRGGRTVAAIGRTDLVSMYARVGMRPLGRTARSGNVSYELMHAATEEIRGCVERRWRAVLARMLRGAAWELPYPFEGEAACFHGGASIGAVGDDFTRLGRRDDVINADVLDAWFPPAPGVLAALSEHLDWIVRTSPPAHAEGFVDALAAARGIPADSVVPGAGSSPLIFRALRAWFGPGDRVLLPVPTYGEYAHVLRQLVGARIDPFPLSASDGFAVDLDLLLQRARRGYDLLLLTNPNNPTGRLLAPEEVERLADGIPRRTVLWIDETYIDYAEGAASLETLAAERRDLVVAKSMSKAYALSGVRAGYLVAHPRRAGELRRLSPPWSLGLPAQIAAVEALRDPDYYAGRYRETGALRERLGADLERCGLSVFPGVANFLLLGLPEGAADAPELIERCRAEGLYLRGFPELGPRFLRTAVKDGPTNARIAAVLERALSASPVG